MKFTDQGVLKIQGFIRICEQLLTDNPITKDSDETLNTTHQQIQAVITIAKILLDKNNSYGSYFWWSKNRTHFNTQVNIIWGGSSTYIPKIYHPLGLKLLLAFKSLIEIKGELRRYFIFEGITDAFLDKFGVNEQTILSELDFFEWSINDFFSISGSKIQPSNAGSNKNQNDTIFALEEDFLSKSETVTFSSDIASQNLLQESSITLEEIDLLIDELSDNKNLTKSNTTILESQFEQEVQQLQLSLVDSLIEDMSQPTSLQSSEIQSSEKTSTKDDTKIRQQRIPKKGNSDGELLGRKMDSFITRFSLDALSSHNTLVQQIIEMRANTLDSNETPEFDNSNESSTSDSSFLKNSPEVNTTINPEQGIYQYKPMQDPDKSQTIKPLTVFEFFVQEFNTVAGVKINLSELFCDTSDKTIPILKKAIKDLKVNDLNLVEVSEKVDFKKAYELLIQFSLRTATFYGIKSDYIKNLSTALFAKLILQQMCLSQQSAQASDSSPSALNGLLELMKQELVAAKTSKELVKIVRRHSEQILALDQAISAGDKFIEENSKQNKKEFINAVTTAMETFYQSPSCIRKMATIALCGLVLSVAVALVVTFAITFPPSVLFTVPLLGKVTAGVVCSGASVLGAATLGSGMGWLGHNLYAQKIDQAAQKESALYREALIIKECLIQTYSP